MDLNWWQSIIPNQIAFNLGVFPVYWYGIIMVIAISVAYLCFSACARRCSISARLADDAALYTIIIGIIGARIYEVLVVDPSYYLQSIYHVINIRGGGLAIHGAILFGCAALIWFAHKKKISLFKILDCTVPAVALGQAIGRWGNFFNQELFGKPTDMPWAISIDLSHRIPQYITKALFHPVFLYESLLDFVLFFILIKMLFSERVRYGYVFLTYIAGYSIIRICLEFFRIDPTSTVFGIRSPIITSIIILIASIIGLWYMKKFPQQKKQD